MFMSDKKQEILGCTPAPRWVRRLQVQIRRHRLTVVAMATTAESMFGYRRGHPAETEAKVSDDRSLAVETSGDVDVVKTRSRTG